MADVQYHIRCKPGDVGEAVLLPGDPGRSEAIAQLFERPRLIARNREYATYTGELDGRSISVCSTGIGSPSTAIAVEELAAVGARTFVRVGTTGSIQENVRFAELVIATAAVRDEGTTPSYVPLAYPAVADVQLVHAMLDAAGRLGQRAHAGIVRSHDSLYTDLHADRMPRRQELTQALQVWHRSRVLCNDMETSAIFVICALRGLRGASILTVVNEPGEADIDPKRVAALDLKPMFDVALAAIRSLAPVKA
jgi:uridine phosphorylase